MSKYEIVKEGLNKNGTKSIFLLRTVSGKDVKHWGSKKECQTILDALDKMENKVPEHVGFHKARNPKPRSTGSTSVAWDVFLNGKKIDTVFYAKHASELDVLVSLVSHDGYDRDINVRKARQKVSNPRASESDDPAAYEIASYLSSVDRSGKQLAEHLRKTAAKPGFDRVRYAEFVAKTHLPRAAEGYYGSKVEAKRFATLATRRVAGEIFVSHILSGEW